jgi:hypothetical protein
LILNHRQFFCSGSGASFVPDVWPVEEENTDTEGLLVPMRGDPFATEHFRGEKKMPASRDGVSCAGGFLPYLGNIQSRGPRAKEHGTRARETCSKKVDRSGAALWHLL